MLKFLPIIILILIFAMPQAFGISILVPGTNSLENAELYGESQSISLDIKFGPDEYQPLLSRVTVHPQIESITLLFYGDEITLSDPELKVVGDGRHFRISSIPDGIIMYGHKDLDDYNINVYFSIPYSGLVKFPIVASIVSKMIPEPEVESIAEKSTSILDKYWAARSESVRSADVGPELVVPSLTKEYIPDLMITSTNDFRTYWNDNFNMDVQIFDGKINKNPKHYEFDGRVDDVSITATISLNDKIIKILKGFTENGNWVGEYYVGSKAIPGTYDIDILAVLGNQTITKHASMFVIGYYKSGPIGGGNDAPIANAGIDFSADDVIVDPLNSTNTILNTITLDGSASYDSDGDVLTYLWTIISAIGNFTLNNETLESPSFNATDVEQDTPIIFGLIVNDGSKYSQQDTVTITIVNSTLTIP